MGELLGELARQGGSGVELAGLKCGECGQEMAYKGELKRGVTHLEGETELHRAYDHCAHCESGLFPLDQDLKLVKHHWTPETIKQAVRAGTEIASHRRAAQSFAEATKIPMSKSSLGRLVNEYGSQLVAQQELEAEATFKAPEKGEAVIWRDIPEPDRETMAISMDGGMVHIRAEGWKEVKICTISAVEIVGEAEDGSPAVRLSHHSYRAGVWDAPTFAKQQWAEGCRRGLEKAKTILSINDGALWIWLIVAMCYAPCVEILDWWHAVEKLWELARTFFSTDQQAAARWAQQQKSHLWHGQLRAIFRLVRRLCPRGTPLPDPVRQALGYLFRNRHRLRYPHFRQAGFPIGSGCVESACKVVMQARMKQAGMRWSREGAQAMLALRATLLSDRWDELWPSLFSGPNLA